MNTINDEWLNYRKMVYPGVELPAEQSRELHMAFFAGALMALKLTVEEAGQLPVELAHEEIVKLINEAKERCRHFVIEGKMREKGFQRE